MLSVFFYKPNPEMLRRRASGFWSLGVWLPAMIAAACIVAESTNTFSSENTSDWLRPVVQHIFGPMNDDAWADVHHLIRKTGHFLGYGAVCLTFLRAWLLSFGTREAMSTASWRWRSCLAAIACTFAVASADEIHQTMIPSRTGQFSDVLLDTCGGTVMCLLLWLVVWRKQASYK
ncbi:VanZ like family protein [Granulicella rosea]|uniref:VanZ like family protein n=1 Tax=Granulicella rosea TaxID=474952 RepID=A0A239KBY4_9BACT|nr:VanZ family protein [Granulicella rosea]SNT15129.1 VanZ like family protein [Granulicella rosea]